jgi:regulator of vacuolar morphogenesis
MPYTISIPSTALSSDPKPHTIYNLTLSTPLRTTVLPKRYSDFSALHAALTSSSPSAPPPAPLPAKGWFSRTVNNADLTETRRSGLEAYLRAIEDAADARWRSAPEYRAFLGFAPSAASIRGESKGTASSPAPGLPSAAATAAAAAASSASLTPAEWLELHGTLRTHLQEARAAIARRDAATAALDQRDAAAAGARALVRARGAAARLDESLRAAEDARSGGNGERKQQGQLGAGETRRRRDLLGRAAAEREALEALLAAWTPRVGADRPADRGGGREELFAGGASPAAGGSGVSSLATSASPPGRSRGLGAAWGATRAGRVLGGAGAARETKRTMERDNDGVLQLQRQIMREQDLDVDALAQGVRRIKEMSIAINEELVEQGQLLDVLDQDVDRYVSPSLPPSWTVGGLANGRIGLVTRLAWRGSGSRRSIRWAAVGKRPRRPFGDWHADTHCLNRRALVLAFF